jgi:restriction system protein
MTAGRFEKGIFVTIASCTAAAQEFCRQHGIDLWEGAGVVKLLDKHDAQYDPELQSALNAGDKHCPRCESRLVQRVARKGGSAGSRFWGCSTYPRCRFVLEA